MAKGNRTNHPNTQLNRKPTPRQKALAMIVQANPDISMGEAVVLAGYSESARKDPRRYIVARGVKSIRDAFSYELNSKISPKYVAKRVKEGIKAKDLNVALKYIQEYSKVNNITQDTATTAIQFNLQGELKDLAD